MADSEDGPGANLSSNGQEETADASSKSSVTSQSSLDRATKEKLMMRKQVSFSADPEESVIITGARDCLCLMASGSDFIKIKPGAREFQRNFFFDQETLSIHWVPSRKKASKVMVEDIVSVQMGQKTESFRTAVNEYPSSRCFSIMLRDNSSIDLVALVPNEAYIWVKGLRCLVTGGLGHLSKSSGDEDPDFDESYISDEEHTSTAEELRDRWLEEIYYAADLNHDGTLEHIEFLELMEFLNKHLTTLHVVRKFKESELCSGGGTLSLEEFKVFYKQIVNRPEVHVVLARYATNNDYLSPEDLQLLLQAEQGVWEITLPQCTELIQKYEPTSDGKTNNYMTVDGFSSFLMSGDNSCFDPGNLDLSFPITDYYIKSTYSSGSAGWPDPPELSKSNYKDVLKNSFRCIRLEVWDGTEEPQVWHKMEDTNRLPLQGVLQTINSAAFEESELPLFINLESHCSPKQNVMVAKLFKDTFKDKLFSSTTVPSLTDIRQKVIIKAKSVHKDMSASNGSSLNSDDSDNEILNSAPSLRKRKRKNGPASDDTLNFPIFFSSYVDEKEGSNCNYSTQLVDTKVDHVIEYNSSELICHNRESYTFVQPQTFSKNIISPLGQWQCGCQFVSVYNAQQDFTTMLNRSMFMQSGGEGIVLKPELLKRECYHYSIDTESPIAGIHPQHLNIRLISAQQLPKPEGSVSKIDTVDPYIVVRIIGIPADSHEYRTYAVKNDGFHPVWEEDVSFTILNPDCAFLHILMLDDDFIGDDYIGQVLVPLKMVRPGFRHLPLCARDGSALEPASVFVHIDIKDYVDISIKRGLTNVKKKGALRTESLRLTAVPNIDSKLKDNQAILDALSADIVRFRTSVMEFNVSSGLDCFAHVRHCLRLLDLRLQTNDCALAIKEDLERDIPVVAVEGVLQVAAVEKAILAFEALTDSVVHLQTEGELHLQNVTSLIAHFDIYRKDVMDFVEGSTEKRRLKALQNYSFNLWLLREYETLFKDTILMKDRMIQHIFAYKSSKIKRNSWMLRKGGAKLLSISEDRSSGSIEGEPPTPEEVFDPIANDGILRPSTAVPTKSSLKLGSLSATSTHFATIQATVIDQEGAEKYL